jgi:hypothetical protein
MPAHNEPFALVDYDPATYARGAEYRERKYTGGFE